MARSAVSYILNRYMKYFSARDEMKMQWFQNNKISHIYYLFIILILPAPGTDFMQMAVSVAG